MSDKVQKIKEEVERLKNHTLDIQKSEDGLVTSVGRGRVEAFNDVLKFIDSLPEEPASEDLKKEISKWRNHYLSVLDNNLRIDLRDIEVTANHFAEWQKQKDQETIELAEDHAMLAGMNKMKEEMMKDAVEGWCTIDGNLYHDIRTTESVNLKRDDKVKIIIVKEEQQ